MSIQVHKPFLIELIFKNTTKTYRIEGFKPYQSQQLGLMSFVNLKQEYGKPIGFKLIDLNLPTHSIKLISLLQEEFKDIFKVDWKKQFENSYISPIQKVFDVLDLGNANENENTKKFFEE